MSSLILFKVSITLIILNALWNLAFILFELSTDFGNELIGEEGFFLFLLKNPFFAPWTFFFFFHIKGYQKKKLVLQIEYSHARADLVEENKDDR